MRKLFFSLVVLVCFVFAGCSSNNNNVSGNNTTIPDTTEEPIIYTGNLEELDLFIDIDFITEPSDEWSGSGKITGVDKSGCEDVIKNNVEFEIIGETENVSNYDKVRVVAKYDKEELAREGYVAEQDEEDVTVISFPYISEANEYTDNVIWVETENTEPSNNSEIWYCLDKEGKTLFHLSEGEEPTTDFYNDTAIVDDSYSDDKTFFVDKKGNVTCDIDAICKEFGSKNYGEDNYSYYIINNDECGFFGVVLMNFSVDSYEWSGESYGILDSKGNWLIEPEKDSYIEEISDGVYDVNNSYYYNIINGKKVSKNGDSDDVLDQWSTELFASKHDGLIFQWNEDVDKRCFVDIKGDKKIDLSKYNVRVTEWGTYPCFNEGYVMLPIDNDQGSPYYIILDVKGNEMCEPQKEIECSELRYGYYLTDEGYMDVKAEYRFGEEFEEAGDFNCERAMVRYSNGGWHCIDLNGNIIY